MILKRLLQKEDVEEREDMGACFRIDGPRQREEMLRQASKYDPYTRNVLVGVTQWARNETQAAFKLLSF